MPFPPRCALPALLLALAGACASPGASKSALPMNPLPLLDRGILHDIPSASGIEAWGDTFLVIGDDSPWLFVLDTALHPIARHPLHDDTLQANIPKAVKTDLEAMTRVRTSDGERIFLFGSGSRSPQRDLLLILDPAAPATVERLDLGPFYRHLRTLAALPDHTLNIEGAAASGDRLWLLHRGTNLLFTLSVHALLDHLRHAAELPAVAIRGFRLPVRHGLHAGFTGATLHPDGKTLLFTAALEQTDNPYDDGRILGSFLGALDPSAETEEPLWCMPVVDPEGTILPVKAESLTLLPGRSGKHPELLLVTDSDGGPSEWIRVRLPH